MSLIIPYTENLNKCKGAFIKPNGKILFTNGLHEEFSIEYCRGKDINQKDIDIFTSSSLNKEQLELFKMWLKDSNLVNRTCSDFLVLLLHFDKVETSKNKIITTTSNKPHIRFFNYYIMEWNIRYLNPLKLDKSNGTFIYDEYNYKYFQDEADRYLEEEISEIKEKVLLKDRHYYFK